VCVCVCVDEHTRMARLYSLSFLTAQSASLSPDRCTCHDVASLLQQFFRELPEPLFTAAHSTAFARVCACVCMCVCVHVCVNVCVSVCVNVCVSE
jgi:hypothetical protein